MDKLKVNIHIYQALERVYSEATANGVDFYQYLFRRVLNKSLNYKNKILYSLTLDDLCIMKLYGFELGGQYEA